jgi:hypothetical protein
MRRLGDELLTDACRTVVFILRNVGVPAYTGRDDFAKGRFLLWRHDYLNGACGKFFM